MTPGNFGNSLIISVYTMLQMKSQRSESKANAPLFIAYDRITYQRLIPNHLADIQCFPKQILKCFEEGAFAISISGLKGHCDALDEAHEMLINH